MNKYTKKNIDSSPVLKNNRIDTYHKTISRLYKYEDTNLSPEQIKQLKQDHTKAMKLLKRFVENKEWSCKLLDEYEKLKVGDDNA